MRNRYLWISFNEGVPQSHLRSTVVCLGNFTRVEGLGFSTLRAYSLWLVPVIGIPLPLCELVTSGCCLWVMMLPVSGWFGPLVRYPAALLIVLMATCPTFPVPPAFDSYNGKF